MPEISSQPLGQSLLQLYSNSLQPNPVNIPTSSHTSSDHSKPAKQSKRSQQAAQRQNHQAQQQHIKQIQQQQQMQAQQQASLQPVISLPSFQLTTESPPKLQLSPGLVSSSASAPHVSRTKSSSSTIPSSPITPASTTPILPEVSTATSLPNSILPTFSEYTSELNDVLQVSSEILNITSSPKSGSANPESPIDVTADLTIDSSFKTESSPPTINTSPISNPETKPSAGMELASISETQDLLDKLQCLSSSGDLSETSILQKLSPSQISLLTSHLESSQTSVEKAQSSSRDKKGVEPEKSHKGQYNKKGSEPQKGLPMQQLEEGVEEGKKASNTSVDADGIITLGGVNKDQLMELEEILSESTSDQEHPVIPYAMNRMMTRKPTISYPAMIAMAILNSDSKRLLLGDIYRYIMEKYPYYRLEGQGWRNSIRHNLSLNDCFMKAGRAESGKGHYWTVRPDSIKEFQNGGYRRRLRRTCTRGGSLSMSREEDSGKTAIRPRISLAPYLSTLKQEICSPASSPRIADSEPEQTLT